MIPWFTRNITKRVNKKFGNAPLVPTMEIISKSCCNCGVTIPMVLVVVFMVMLLSIDTMRSNNTVVFSIGSPGKDPVYLNGIYKMAFERNDGSIDVVFNIPKGAEALLKANISSSGIDPEIFNMSYQAPKVNTTATPVVVVRHNIYPLTIDAEYSINPVSLCPHGKKLDYIIIVHSATAYFQRRKVIRETYAAKKLFGTVEQRIIFLLGETNDPKTTRSINLEALAYGDILQGPFSDSYHNLTHKGVMGFRWINEYCPNVRLVVKVDDDVFMNPFQFVMDYLPLYSAKSRSIACHVRPAGTSVIERGKGKWQVKFDEFRGHVYFPFSYCHGYFVILTPDLLRPLLLAVKMNPFFWIDDVYLYGMLPATIGNVSFHSIRSNITMSFTTARGCYADKGRNCTMLAAGQWKDDEQTTLWRMALNFLVKEEKERLQLFQLSKH